MPYCSTQGAKIFWREVGAGPPLLLIMGLGYSSDMWHHVEFDLSKHFRVIVFDNRGIGRSKAIHTCFTIDDLAADALCVMEAARMGFGFVFGLSMGGFVAQELALKHPERVQSLGLGVTACGGPHMVLAEPKVREALIQRTGLSPEESVRMMHPYIYHHRTPIERITEDTNVRLAHFPSAEIYMQQLDAISQWKSCDRLHRLDVPTLIIHGEQDRLVPVANAVLLAEHIRNAQLCRISSASHIITTDAPGRFVSELKRFHDSV